VVVYFSGHGPNQNGINYLSTGRTESFPGRKLMPKQAYSLNTLAQKVKGAIFADHIGSIASLSSSGAKASTKSFVTVSPAVGNQAILSAAQPERSNKQHWQGNPVYA
jgi:hypothetical protein